jgi:hypothetical protein
MLIAASGTAESFLKAAHVCKTRVAHQITALTLANLQNSDLDETTTN